MRTVSLILFAVLQLFPDNCTAHKFDGEKRIEDLRLQSHWKHSEQSILRRIEYLADQHLKKVIGFHKKATRYVNTFVTLSKGDSSDERFIRKTGEEIQIEVENRAKKVKEMALDVVKQLQDFVKTPAEHIVFGAAVFAETTLKNGTIDPKEIGKFADFVKSTVKVVIKRGMKIAKPAGNIILNYSVVGNQYMENYTKYVCERFLKRTGGNKAALKDGVEKIMDLAKSTAKRVNLFATEVAGMIVIVFEKFVDKISNVNGVFGKLETLADSTSGGQYIVREMERICNEAVRLFPKAATDLASYCDETIDSIKKYCSWIVDGLFKTRKINLTVEKPTRTGENQVKRYFLELKSNWDDRAKPLDQSGLVSDEDNRRKDTYSEYIPITRSLNKRSYSFDEFLSNMRTPDSEIDVNGLIKLTNLSSKAFYDNAMSRSKEITKMGLDYFTETMAILKKESGELGDFALNVTSKAAVMAKQDKTRAREFVRTQKTVSNSMIEGVYGRIERLTVSAYRKIENYSTSFKKECLESTKVATNRITRIAHGIKELFLNNVTGKHEAFLRLACASVETLAIHVSDQMILIQRSTNKKIEELVAFGFAAFEDLGTSPAYVAVFDLRSAIVEEEVRMRVPRKQQQILEFIAEEVSGFEKFCDQITRDLKQYLDVRFNCVLSNCSVDNVQTMEKL